jgi:hypothetical protein
MRRIALIVFAVVCFFVSDPHPAKALPRYGIERYYYSNACYMTASCRMYDPGMPGSYLGARVNGCFEQYATMTETQLIGRDNWKDEIVTDCSSGYAEETLYHGGYQYWTAANPSSGCYCDF